MTALTEKRQKREEDCRLANADIGRHQAAYAAAFFAEIRPTVGWFAAVYLTGKGVSAYASETIKAFA